MIQRIQSIFLLLVAISMGLMLAFPIWQKSSFTQKELVELNAYFLTHTEVPEAPVTEAEIAVAGEDAEIVIAQEVAWYIAILASLATVLALYSIFRYDNRLLQMKLAALNSLLIGGTLVACIFLTMEGQEMLPDGGEGTRLTGFYLPVVALLCNMLANRFIRKDEALVRSSDRFR